MCKFADRLKLLRIEKGLNQTELAEQLSVNQRSVSNWENSLREPSFEMLMKLAQILEVSTDYLLGLED
ncbi:MAG: helix-turn-helix domain-containing protein [Clostridia bacterium]|nr:helix-turn-helix domain-containing protein [Clostridia bacterium]